VDDFPSDPRRFCVAAFLTGSAGEGTIELRSIRLATGEQVYRQQGRISFRDQTDVVSVVFRIHKIRFPAPGFYLFQLLIDGQLVPRPSAGSAFIDYKGRHESPASIFNRTARSPDAGLDQSHVEEAEDLAVRKVADPVSDDELATEVSGGRIVWIDGEEDLNVRPLPANTVLDDGTTLSQATNTILDQGSTVLAERPL
jgi:hypothetical protein